MILDPNAAVRFSKSPSSVIPNQKELVMNPSNLKRPAIVRIGRARANPARSRRRVRSLQLRSRYQAAQQKGARCPDVAREPRERNRVHDDLLLGERRSDEQIYGRRSYKGSSSRTGLGIPHRTPEGGADPAPPKE